MKMRMRALAVGIAIVACACKRDANSVSPDPTPSVSASTAKTPPTEGALSLSVPWPAEPGDDASGKWLPLVRVGADGLVRFGPDGATTNGGPAMHLKKGTLDAASSGDRVVDATGVEVVACRAGGVVLEGPKAAHLLPDGFATDDRRVTIAVDGTATVAFAGGDVATMRYHGLAPGDACTAALLYYLIPVPAAL